MICLLVAMLLSVGGPEACDLSPAGERAGESVDARIERLETQLRLSKAERAVNRRRR